MCFWNAVIAAQCPLGPTSPARPSQPRRPCVPSANYRSGFPRYCGRLATSRTLPPSASTSASSAAFSCALRTRRRSDGPKMSISLKKRLPLESRERPPEISKCAQEQARPLHVEGRTHTEVYDESGAGHFVAASSKPPPPRPSGSGCGRPRSLRTPCPLSKTLGERGRAGGCRFWLHTIRLRAQWSGGVDTHKKFS